eukprot:NODE_467_length_2720_cov_33.651906_g400_i0.p1 GENE.NODE_467_length_2720_cov_33.651906_g400_i0~~NODE_467_length_2720_cov_33.651906_g400_i0.p1  ORF type:complete len:855 (-),score=106.67 NODE_467_length_2720_cov_33.651906_g400_i0:156-2477(-)
MVTSNITNGSIGNNNANNNGGGMFSIDSRFINLTSTLFNSNIAKRGAGVHYSGDEIEITNCTFLRNNATIGGGIFTEKWLRMANNKFRDNIADVGAGMATNSWINVNSLFQNNKATQFGGAVAYLNSSSFPTTIPYPNFSDFMNLYDKYFINNSATYYGKDVATPPAWIEINGSLIPTRYDIIDNNKIRYVLKDYFRSTIAEEIIKLYGFSYLFSETLTTCNKAFMTDEITSTEFEGWLATYLSSDNLNSQNFNLLVYSDKWGCAISKNKIPLQECPAGYTMSGDTFIDRYCQPCAAGYYKLRSGNTNCHPCDNTNSKTCFGNQVSSRAGTWISPIRSDGSVILYRCPVRTLCGESSTSILQCDGYHDPTSLLCGGCVAGRYVWNDKCILENNTNYALVAVIYFFSIIFVYYLYFNHYKPHKSMIASFFPQFLQMVNLSYDTQQEPLDFQSFIAQGSNAGSGQTSSFIGMQMSVEMQQCLPWVTFLGLNFILAQQLLVHTLLEKFKKVPYPVKKTKYLEAAYKILILSTFSCSVGFLKNCLCIRIENSTVVLFQPYLECWKSSHYFVVISLGSFCILFLFILGLLAYLIEKKNYRWLEDVVLQSTSKDSIILKWWLYFSLGIRLIYVGAFVLMTRIDSEIADGLLGMIVVCVIYTLLVSWFKPYKIGKDSLVVSVSLCVFSVVMVLNMDRNKVVKILAGLVMLICYCAIIFYWIYNAIWLKIYKPSNKQPIEPINIRINPPEAVFPSNLSLSDSSQAEELSCVDVRLNARTWK